MTDTDVLQLFEIDAELLERTIVDAAELNDNEAMFERLLEFSRAKKKLAEALEAIDAKEREVKGFINAKAKALYGNDWQVIAGQNYKITRSQTGLRFNQIDGVQVPKKFLIIKEALNADAIELELEKTGKLPAGVEVNSSRGESIRIAVKEDEQS